MADEDTTNIVPLPVPKDRGPIFSGSSELETFYYHLTSAGYSHYTASNYVSILRTFFERLPSNVQEARIYEFVTGHFAPDRIRIFLSAWRRLHDWLAPRGFQITPLPKRPGAGGRPKGPRVPDATGTKLVEKPRPPPRVLFRGFNDLFGYRQYIRGLGFGEETTELYFRIAAEALHFLEGDARCSAETINAILEKAKKRYPHLDPQGVRFLRVWAHLHDYARPLGYEVTVLARPSDLQAKAKSLRAPTQEDIQAIATQDTPLDSEPVEEF